MRPHEHRGDGDRPVATVDRTASISPAERARREHTPSGGSAPPDATPAGNQGPAAVALPIDPTERYELAGVHGRGGLGRVVKALDRRLGRTVAIKELLRRTPAAEARFVREALITARLEHPGIVPVHEAGRWPSGDPYYAMKLVSGRTLKELVQDRPELDQRLALLPHVIAVAEAIGYAHSQGVIHRDIKPTNVVVGDFGETVVIDWGLAKDQTGQVDDTLADDAVGLAAPAGDRATAADDSDSDGTAAGNVMGTPAYMSPEQARGEEVDARADVFSLGALLYEVLAGVPPYTGDSSDAILQRAIAGPLPSVELCEPAAPRDVCAIVRKATARDPARRYATAKELAEDLKRFQTGQLVTARDYSSRTLLWRWLVRNRGIVGVAAAAGVALAAVGVVSVNRVVEERNQAESQRALAENALDSAKQRSVEMIYLQAQSSLHRDPTAAVAWLKQYPTNAPQASRLEAVLDEATALGVARHVWRQSSWLHGVAILPGSHQVVTGNRNGDIYVMDPVSGAARLVGHQDEGVLAMAASPDGHHVATASDGGVVAIWDLGDGSHVISAGTGEATEALRYSSDGQRIALSTMGYGDRIIDATTGKTVWQAGESGHSAAMSGDGTMAFRVTRERVVERIELATGATRRLATVPVASTRMVASPDGSRLIVQGLDDVTRVIDVASGALRDLGRQPARFGWVSFSPSGKLAATAGTDATVRVYDLDSGSEQILRGHEDSVYQVLFGRDDSRLYSASDDGTIRIWDLRFGSARVLRGHDDDVYRIALSDDESLLASASLDSSARLWSLHFDDSRMLVGQPGEVNQIYSIHDGRGLVLSTASGDVAAWDLDAGTEVVDHVAPPDSHGAAMISPDGRYAGSRGKDKNRPSIFDRVTGKRSYLEMPGGSEMTGAVFDSASSRLATIDKNDTVVVWQLPSLTEVSFSVPVKPRTLGFSPDGKRLIVAGGDKLLLVDATSGAVLRSAELAPIQVNAFSMRPVLFSDDGRHVVVPTSAGHMPLWDLESGDLRLLDLGVHLPLRVSFSPDGAWLAVGLTDRSIRVFDVGTGHARVLTGHSDLVMSVAFSPDSRLLASASYDKTVRLWQVGSWTSRVLRGHVASVDGVVFGPDGKTVVSVGRDGTVRVWPVTPASDVLALPARMAEITSTQVDSEGRATTPAI